MGLGDFLRRKKVEKTVINNYYSAPAPKSAPTPSPQRPVVNNYNTYNSPPQRQAPVNYGGQRYAPPPMGYQTSYYGGRPGYYDPAGTFIELMIWEEIFDGFDHDRGNETIINNDNTYVDNSQQDSNNNVDTQDWGQQDSQGYDSGYSYDSGSSDSGYSYDSGSSSYDTGSYDSGSSYDSGGGYDSGSSFDSGGGGW